MRTVSTAETGTIVWDAEVKGFGLRVMPSGTRQFILKYRAGNVQRWITIGKHGSPWTPDAARSRAKQLLADVAKGGDPARERDRVRDNPSVADLVRQFKEEHIAVKAKPRTAIEYERILDRFIVPKFGQMRTMDVRPEDIARLHHELRATPRQANITINTARKMFQLAEGWGYRPLGSNPCVHIQRFRETRRERFLSREEISRLGETLARCSVGWTDQEVAAWQARCLAAALAEGRTIAEATIDVAARTPKRREPEHPSAIAALHLLLLTGARMSEALGLTWQMVDWTEGVLRLPDSKTGAKSVPLAPEAERIIEAQLSRRESGNPFVFPGAAAGKQLADLEKPWQRIRAVAGLADVRIHDLRHTFASHGVMGGLSLPVLGRVLGHRSSATTQRYAHFADDPVRRAAEAVAKPIADLLAPQAAPPGEVVPLRRPLRGVA